MVSQERLVQSQICRLPGEANAPRQLFHRKSVKETQIPFDNASYKLYYVNYEIGLKSTPAPTHQKQAGSRLLPLSYFLSAIFPDFCWASS
jgi:hypothetical protein